MLVVLSSFTPLAVSAQIFATLHSFTNSPDGADPGAALILSGNTFYGTTLKGGSFGAGTVFRINTDGTGLTNLYSFSAIPHLTNSDGAWPAGVLALMGKTLFGTTFYGGLAGNGTVFRINIDGSGFTNLYNFTATFYNGSVYSYTNSDGARPDAGLIISGNTLYGTALDGGKFGDGTVFGINIDGTSFTNLYTFTGQSYNDGSAPMGSLVISGNTLYGTASGGGNYGEGTVFRINTDATSYTNLYSFYGDSDGSLPGGSLIISGNTLYGTAEWSGVTGLYGSVFSLTTGGTDFKPLHTFTGSGDGSSPQSGVILSGNRLYGTATQGGSANNGMIFAINTDGTGYTNLHSFTATSGTKATNADGTVPFAGLLCSGHILYGMASAGGMSGFGTLFNFSLPVPPQLTITSAGTNILLIWPTNATGFTLEFATNLVSSTVWSTNSRVPVVIGGQNVVTDTITRPMKFYQLISQ